MLLNKPNIVNFLKDILNFEQLEEIKSELSSFKLKLQEDENEFLNITETYDNIVVNDEFFENELQQIFEAKTIERAKYYIQRLIKSLCEEKINEINDLNLNRWKEYTDIITDSLWILDKRDSSGVHNAGYWGNFIPQIPNQLLRRYTKKGDWVLDTFLGSGTTLIECKRLGRNGIGIELQQNVADIAKSLLEKENNIFSEEIKTKIVVADSVEIDYTKILNENRINSIQFLIMHPPYWDIIKFSTDEKDLSNANSLEEFLNKLGTIVDKTYDILDKGRYFALVIGDKYSKGDWIPLGFYSMQEVLKRKYKLKSIIVKNFDQTRGKMNQKELWRYRALVGGFYIFKHEYIFLFQKVK